MSYATPDRDLAAELAQTLRNQGDRVFFDKDSLLAGADFNQQIRNSIKKSDRFIFIATATSLSEGRYTVTELNEAKHKWESPVGRVITVLADNSVQYDDLDPYLRSVQVIDPEGNMEADVASAIDRARPVGLFCRLISLLLLAAAAVGGYFVATNDWSLGETKRAEVQMLDALNIGHWTGASTVLTRLNFANPTEERVYFTLGTARLISPTGQEVPVFPSAIVMNGIDQPLLPAIEATAGGSITFDFEYRAFMTDSIAVHSQLNNEAMTGRFTGVLQPQDGLLTDNEAQRLADATEKDWTWSSGTWTFSLNYRESPTMGMGDSRNVALEFDVSDVDISLMKSIIDEYHTGAGVTPAWRRINKFGSLMIIQKDARPVPSAPD